MNVCNIDYTQCLCTCLNPRNAGWLSFAGVTCPLERKIFNGQVFPLGHLYFCGTMVRFRCYPHFKLVGASSTVCGIHGNWSQPFPTCERQYCPTWLPNMFAYVVCHLAHFSQWELLHTAACKCSKVNLLLLCFHSNESRCWLSGAYSSPWKCVAH